MTACHLVRLGRGGLLAKDAVQRGYIAVDYGMADDFTDRFSDELAAFNRTNIPCFPNPPRARPRSPPGWPAAPSVPSARGFRKATT
jgi:hypothetical protein